MAARSGVDKTLVKNTLIKAREILEKRGWTKGTFARDISGFVTLPDSGNAKSFCLAGAISRGIQELGYDDLFCEDVTIHMYPIVGLKPPIDDVFGEGNNIFAWNDKNERTKDEVIEALSKTIEIM